MNPVTRELYAILKAYRKAYPARVNAVRWINEKDERGNVNAPETGICYQIAKLVASRVPGAKPVFTYLSVKVEDGVEEWPVHCVIEYEGLYYDTYNPRGVRTIKELIYGLRQDIQDELYWPTTDEDAEIAERCYQLIPLCDFIFKQFQSDFKTIVSQ
jgi:hypothetical protein